MREGCTTLEEHIRSGKEIGMLEKFAPHDLYAAAVFIDPALVKRSVRKSVEIELEGKSRGACLVAWYDHLCGPDSINVEII